MIWFDGEELTTEKRGSILSALEHVTEVTPSELYITAFVQNNRMTVHLYNTDPVNWDLFMFPYNSEKFRFDFDQSKAESFLENPEPFFKEVPIRGSQFILPTMFEIKKSQSTGKDTLYVFTHEHMPLEKEFSWEKQELTFSSPEETKEYFSHHGDKYSTNTLTTLLRLWKKENEHG